MKNQYFKKIVIRLFDKILEASKRNKYDIIKKKYNLPKSFKFNGDGILMYGNGKIIIGENCYIGQFSSIQVNNNCEVRIGENSALSHNIRIYTTSYVSDQDFSLPKKNVYSKNVIIGKGVWIGANVIINPGVEIGDNSIIGANSIVTKNIPTNSICGGVPAKIIRLKNV